MTDNVSRQWGKTRITGGRHAFRIKLFLDEATSRVKPPARVLDAGCGDGSMSLALLQAGYQVTSVDLAEGGLNRLKKTAVETLPTEALASHQGCARASLTDLPFPDSSFDMVVSGEVLEHLEDHEAAVSEFFRVLKPGGVVSVTVPANPGLFGIEDEWAGHLRRYRPEELVSLFQDAGFTKLSLHHWGWPVTWLYNQIFYKFWLSRKIKNGSVDFDPGQSVGGNPLIMKAMYLAFSIDRLFKSLPFGIGLIGSFQKPG
jgi:ubiquinone/menaquinone biosynthesis C-methylase UbiE